MENFKVIIRDTAYHIKLTPSDISINGIYRDNMFNLDKVNHNKIKNRLFHNIKNIEKLKAGKIRKYRIFNELELNVISAYLTNKNILFRIFFNDTKRLYNINDKIYELGRMSAYAEKNKFFNNSKYYIQVYKGYINMLEHKYISFPTNSYIPSINKYGIYIWK